MAKLFFSVLLFVRAINCTAQAYDNDFTSQTRKFTEFCFNDADKPLLVAQNLDSFTVETIKETLSSDTFFRRVSSDNWKTVTVDTFVLTDEERRFVDSSVQNLYNFSWQAAILPKSIILGKQSLDSLMASGPDMPKYLKARFKTDKFYWLSKPIFLRNYTYCIFYIETNNGKPGGSTLNFAIYVIANKEWKKLMNIKIVQN